VTRIAVLSDIHGNLPALEAVAAEIRRMKPDGVLVAGDLVMNGPDPNGCVDALRFLESEGALIVSGNTDIAVGDFDYGSAFPQWQDGVPDTVTAAAEWAHDELGDEQLAWLRRLPSERRMRAADGTLVLVVHASPGSQTRGFDQALDANIIFERAAQTDSRVICVGHTHVPEVRDLGFKVIVNSGSCGYVFDGDPTASWAMVDIHEGNVVAEIKRTAFDVLSVANAISARGLPGDVYRAATVRTGKLVR
jgi:predicted phosphodiesterase